LEVKFVKSSNDYKKCPPGTLPEFAFIGRSNVGKSSLINVLAQVGGLAKISSRPGKTQLINHFLVDDKWALVDLPGYGYARTSKTNRSHFDELIKGYITTRANLLCLFVLIDSRLEPQKIDLEFLSFLGEQGIPFALIFTKTDKISSNKVQSGIAAFKKAMLEQWEEIPEIFISSAITKAGRDEILTYIKKVMVSVKNAAK
jgi:GTP-binding protein